jgi:hypothetical protein
MEESHPPTALELPMNALLMDKFQWATTCWFRVDDAFCYMIHRVFVMSAI